MSRLSDFHERETGNKLTIEQPIRFNMERFVNSDTFSLESIDYSQEGIIDNIKKFVAKKVENFKDNAFVKYSYDISALTAKINKLSKEIHLDKVPLLHEIELNEHAHILLTPGSKYNVVVDPNTILKGLEDSIHYVKNTKFVNPKRYYGIMFKDKFEKLIVKNGVTETGLLKTYDALIRMPELKFDTFIRNYESYTGLKFKSTDIKTGVSLTAENLFLGHGSLYSTFYDSRGTIKMYYSNSYLHTLFKTDHKKPFKAKALSGKEIDNLLKHTGDALKTIELADSELLNDLKKHASLSANAISEELYQFIVDNYVEKLKDVPIHLEELIELCYPFYANSLNSFDSYRDGLHAQVLDNCKAIYLYCRDANRHLKDIQ